MSTRAARTGLLGQVALQTVQAQGAQELSARSADAGSPLEGTAHSVPSSELPSLRAPSFYQPSWGKWEDTAPTGHARQEGKWLGHLLLYLGLDALPWSGFLAL